jgi:hypothetical protein
MFLLDRIGPHEEKSLRRPHRCPFAVTALKCTWQGYLFNIKSHVMIRHTLLNHEVKGEEFKTSLEEFGTNTSWHETAILHEQVFFLCSRLVGIFFYSCLLFVGPQGRECNYSYTIRIETTDSQEVRSACQETLMYLTDIDEIFKTGNCFVVNKEFVKKCLDMKGELQLQVKICRNDN